MRQQAHRVSGCQSPKCGRGTLRRGFTMIELLVVIAIMGVVMSLLGSAVQSARESARRAQCRSNLRQMTQALHNFHSAFNRFPPGNYGFQSLNQSWCTFLLPYIDQSTMFNGLNFSSPMTDPGGNLAIAQLPLPLFRCPSALDLFDGQTDYGGIIGSDATGLQPGNARNQAFGCGALVTVNSATPDYVSIRDLTDGSSQTICIAECANRDPPSGAWASGFNIFSQDSNPPNSIHAQEMFSFHPLGVHAARADGSVSFISQSIDLYVLGALCTGNGGEVVQDPNE